MPGDLEERLTQLERPTADRIRVTGDGLLSRLRGAGLSRAVPLPVAVAIAELRGRAEWWRRGARERAREWARIALLDACDDEVDALARRHLIETAVQVELSWRLWLSGRRLAIEGVEHLDSARSQGRGVIIAVPHVGPLGQLTTALGPRLGRVYLTLEDAAEWGMDLVGPKGRWMKMLRSTLEASGVRGVHRGDSFDLLVALLRRGEVVWVVWDIPGTRPQEVLGRTISTSAGLGLLVEATGAAVVPVMSWREGRRVRSRVWPAISGEAGADAVMSQLVEDFEEGISPRLEQAHENLRYWLRPAAGG